MRNQHDNSTGLPWGIANCNRIEPVSQLVGLVGPAAGHEDLPHPQICANPRQLPTVTGGLPERLTGREPAAPSRRKVALAMSLDPAPVQTPPATTAEESSNRRLIRELIVIAIPLALSSGSVTLMHVIDRMFLTWYSPDALAAVMPASMFNWTLLSLFVGTANYVSTFVSQYEGAKRPDRVAAVLWQGLYFSMGAGLCITLLGQNARHLFAFFKHPPEIQQLESMYFQTLLWGTTPVLMSAVFGAYFSGRGQPMVTLYVNLIGVAINLTLDWMLIFGHGPFSEMGMYGAAIATVIAEACMTGVYILWLLYSPGTKAYAIWSHWRFDNALFQRVLRFGLPSGFHFLLDVLGFNIFIQVVGSVGKEMLAATNLAFNLNMLAFMPIVGLGTAVSILVGKRIGEGHPRQAIKVTWVAFSLAAVYMGTFGIIYVGLPDLLISPYIHEGNKAEFERIRPVVIDLLKFVAVYSVFDAMAITFASALRGAGDTRFAMLYSFATGWLIMVLPTYFGVYYWGWGVDGAWYACTGFIVVLGLGFMGRFIQGKWQSMRVIEVAPPLVEVTPDTVVGVS